MPPKFDCPACGSDMRSRELLPGFSLKPWRVCPDCGARYAVDCCTRKRLYLVVVLALATFACALVSHFLGFPWGLLTLIVALGNLLYTGYTVSRMRYVEYRD